MGRASFYLVLSLSLALEWATPLIVTAQPSPSPSPNPTLSDTVKLEIHKQVNQEVEQSKSSTMGLLNFLITVLAATPIAIGISGFILRGAIIEALVRTAREQAQQQMKAVIASELETNVKLELEKQAEESLTIFKSQLLQYESEAKRNQEELTEGITTFLKRIQAVAASQKDPALYEEIKATITTLQAEKKPAGVSSYSECHTLGMMAHMAGDYSVAITFFDRAIEIDACNPEAWRSKGDTLYRLGEYLKALDAYNEAIKMNSKDYEALTYKGNVLVCLKQYDQAIHLFNDSISINHKFPYSWYYLARCYALNNDIDKSLKTLRTAIDLNSICREMAIKDNRFRPIHQNPLFQELVGIP